MGVLRQNSIVSSAFHLVSKNCNNFYSEIPRFCVYNPVGRRRFVMKSSSAIELHRPPLQLPISCPRELMESLVNKEDLSEEEAEGSLDFLLSNGSEALISAFLVLLRAKGETFEEVVGMARAMIKCCKKVEGLENAVDIVGTGGDGANMVLRLLSCKSSGSEVPLITGQSELCILTETQVLLQRVEEEEKSCLILMASLITFLYQKMPCTYTLAAKLKSNISYHLKGRGEEEVNEKSFKFGGDSMAKSMK